MANGTNIQLTDPGLQQIIMRLLQGGGISAQVPQQPPQMQPQASPGGFDLQHNPATLGQPNLPPVVNSMAGEPSQGVYSPDQTLQQIMAQVQNQKAQQEQRLGVGPDFTGVKGFQEHPFRTPMSYLARFFGGFNEGMYGRGGPWMRQVEQVESPDYVPQMLQQALVNQRVAQTTGLEAAREGREKATTTRTLGMMGTQQRLGEAQIRNLDARTSLAESNAFYIQNIKPDLIRAADQLKQDGDVGRFTVAMSNIISRIDLAQHNAMYDMDSDTTDAIKQQVYQIMQQFGVAQPGGTNAPGAGPGPQPAPPTGKAKTIDYGTLK